jgi:hypothetical protein
VTVGVAVKVFDGIVLAADSATTLDLFDEKGNVTDHQVYNNANKIFHLHRNLPVAAMTYGLGQLGGASISSIAKDLRQRFMGLDNDRLDWQLTEGYTLEQVTDRLVELMFDELYEPLHGAAPPKSPLGFFIAGYSDKSSTAEAWEVIIHGPDRPTPSMSSQPDRAGWWAVAQNEAIGRLFNGIDPQLAPAVVATAGNKGPAVMKQILSAGSNPAVAPMPLADAVDLARFMVDTTIGYRRFLPGADTVGGPVELAAISRHEGFRWISRKHYYPPNLNPKDPH